MMGHIAGALDEAGDSVDEVGRGVRMRRADDTRRQRQHRVRHGGAVRFDLEYCVAGATVRQ